MNLNQIRAFTELMISGSVSEAARNLNRTQPSVSTLISNLEDELGLQLFERRNGRLHPVPEAKYLFEEYSGILKRLDNAGDFVRRIKSLETGELKIASMPGPSAIFVPSLVARHDLEEHDVRYTIVSRTSDAVYQLIAAQQYDIGVADYDPETASETALIHSNVFRFRCLCAVLADDELAQKPTVSAKDLSDRKLATLYYEEPLFERMERAFEESGSKMNASFLTQNFISLLTFVETGVAAAIVDPVTAESYRLFKGKPSSIVFKELEPAITFDIAVITPRYRPLSLVAKNFLERLSSELSVIENCAPS